MPPKRRNRKKKTVAAATTNTTTTKPPTQNNSKAPIFSIPPPPPSFFLNDDSDMDDLPYDPYEEYKQYDDFTNPFDPSYFNNSDSESDSNTPKPPSFPFKLVQDLDAFIQTGGPKTAGATLKLPLTVFLNIISRLPIKPLAICRCVCKTWATIIHHPRFLQLHHHNLSHTLTPVTPAILFHVQVREDNEVYNEMFVSELDKNECVEKHPVANPKFMPPLLDFMSTGLRYEIVGSCNGLVCLAEPVYNDPVYVCNPVIGEFVTLPHSGKKIGYEIFSGIGFDKIGNEYKVVRVVFDCKDKKMEAEIYTIGGNKWRKLGQFGYPVFKRSGQVFVGGGLHWMTEEYGVKELILCFDVGKEKFSVVPPPSEFNLTSPEFDSCGLQLGELGGKLCLFAHSFDDRCEVWVMKEYGVKDSWSKEYVIPREVFGYSGVCFKPLWLTKDGNILLVITNQSVVCYYPRRKRFQKLKMSFPSWFDAIIHVGSFISFRDIANPTKRQQCLSRGEWYGIMEQATSHNSNSKTGGSELTEQLRRLWFESH